MLQRQWYILGKPESEAGFEPLNDPRLFEDGADGVTEPYRRLVH